MRFLLILTTLAALAAPSLAQPSPSPSASPSASAAAIDAARQAVAGNDLAAAIEILSGLGAEADPPARGFLGALYLETGQPARALELLAPLAEDPGANPAILYNAGRAARRLGRDEEGITFLKRSVALAPDSPAARELGLHQAQARRYAEAYALLRPWANANPEDREARLLAALAAVQLQRPSEAESLLSDLPQDDPKVRLLWGRLLTLKADPWGALATLKPLLEGDNAADPAIAPLVSDARRLVAEAYAAVGEAAKAVELLDGHVDSPSVALQLGQAQYQSGDLEGAIATLEPFAAEIAARAAGGDTFGPGLEHSLIVEYGRLLAIDGRHPEALPLLELATRSDPRNKQAWQQLGQTLAAVGRRDEARAALDRFQELVTSEVPSSLSDLQLEKDLEDPTGRELREAMKRLSQERPEEALAIARREQQLNPGDLRPYLVEANILLVTGRVGEALEAVDRIVQGAPWSADAVYLRGTVLIAADETDAAEIDLRKALELSPDHTAAMNDLAVILIDRGEIQEARDLLARALELRPDDALARANLERLSGRLGG